MAMLSRPKFVFLSLIICQVWYIFSSMHNQTSSLEDVSRCKPVKKVAFMMTHKCSSSSIQNILYRHAFKNDLNVALLHQDNSTLEPGVWRNHLTGTWKDIRWEGLEMDLLADNFRWEKNKVTEILGSNGTRIVTILHNPVDLFESYYYYYSLDQVYGLSLKELIQLLQNTSTTEINNKYGGLRTKDGIFGRNQMAWDLGLPPASFDDENAINQLILEIEKDFDLVMIAEWWDESLILLRHLLCWPLESVTYLPISTVKQEHTPSLTQDERQVLKQFWLATDEKIYRHFYNILDTKMADFSRSFIESEVQLLRWENTKIENRCVLSNNSDSGYVLNNKEQGCNMYGFVNIAFHSIFRRRMTEKAAKFVA